MTPHQTTESEFAMMVWTGPEHQDGRRIITVTGATKRLLEQVIARSQMGTDASVLGENPEVVCTDQGAALVVRVPTGKPVFDVIPCVKDYLIDVVASYCSNHCGSHTRAPVSNAGDKYWLRSVVTYVLMPRSPALPNQELDEHRTEMLCGILECLSGMMGILSPVSRTRLTELQRGLPSRL